MTGRMVFERVRPLGWAGALARGAWTVADNLRPGIPTADPYVCGRGHVTRRLTGRQAAAVEGRRLPACRWCGDLMVRRPDPTEEAVRAALATAVERVEPSPEALERIRARLTQTNTAPRQDTRETTS